MLQIEDFSAGVKYKRGKGVNEIGVNEIGVKYI